MSSFPKEEDPPGSRDLPGPSATPGTSQTPPKAQPRNNSPARHSLSNLHVTLINMPESHAIEIRDLFFYYLTPTKKPLFDGLALPFSRIALSQHIVLQNLDLTVRLGKTTALLGQNGSGKTSLIKLITGIRLPHRGHIEVLGGSPRQVRHRLGLCLGNYLIYYRLSARENLEYYGKLYNVPDLSKRIAELGEILELAPVMDDMVETFSYGMKAKLALARSLIHRPELLILDEPTLGIDIHIARQIRQFIKDLNCTVLLTTHYMEEAEFLADDLCIIEKGRILASGAKDQVLSTLSVDSVSEAFTKVVERTHSLRAAS